ncbi:rna-directed dna polymerase from mobile element jockey-like [Pitangus sulphuratus]|nr:rna-directed dna polymerase from mobile element jockey-like [Pitangus sulphuratus]
MMFRRDGGGRRGGGVALYIRRWIECEELSLKNSHEQVESLWLQEALHSQALILLGDFNYPNVYWESSTESCRQSRRLLECMEDNFLSQVIESPTRGNVILDLLVTNASQLIGDIKIGGSLGCSDHALVEFAVLRDTGQYVDKRIKCILSKFAGNTKLSGAVDTPEGRDTIQRGLDKLKKWAHGKLMRFKKTKCKVLHLGWDNPRYQYRLGDKQPCLGSPDKKDLGILVDERLDMIWQYARAAQKASYILGCIKCGQQVEGSDSASLLL